MLTAVVGGTAYALFSSSVTASGVTFATGNANLEFWSNGPGVVPASTWTQNVTFPTTFQNLYPGYNGYNEFYLRNTSTSPISLRLSARLTAATGDWGVLSPVITAWIGDDAGAVGSGYYTLADWNSLERDITITLAQSEQKLMRIYVQVPSDAGNSIANKTTATTWLITGTQVAP
ncbi:hypothetical protein A2446_02365 [Candidatus Roizmanbacteria bacterium RIFOXYC2_FULL_38_9]|nr:MAG: hypothetical protein A3K21_02005 [Candidatus Roizmanbacteria bacterium RIFOXYC1_FULL_38_14]OGK72433.1 MAG: hypothetical protein A2446_02365 [Candidatus Roizmanbacteria bacterium RIFOXYC2_FULL_38_9]